MRSSEYRAALLVDITKYAQSVFFAGRPESGIRSGTAEGLAVDGFIGVADRQKSYPASVGRTHFPPVCPHCIVVESGICHKFARIAAVAVEQGLPFGLRRKTPVFRASSDSLVITVESAEQLVHHLGFHIWDSASGVSEVVSGPEQISFLGIIIYIAVARVRDMLVQAGMGSQEISNAAPGEKKFGGSGVALLRKHYKYVLSSRCGLSTDSPEYRFLTGLVPNDVLHGHYRSLSDPISRLPYLCVIARRDDYFLGECSTDGNDSGCVIEHIDDNTVFTIASPGLRKKVCDLFETVCYGRNGNQFICRVRGERTDQICPCKCHVNREYDQKNLLIIIS